MELAQNLYFLAGVLTGSVLAGLYANARRTWRDRRHDSST